MKTTLSLFIAGAVLATPLAAMASSSKDNQNAATAGHSTAASKVFGATATEHTSTAATQTHTPAATALSKVASTNPDASHSSAAASTSGHASHWGYAGAAGPDNWGSLKAEYSVCGTGRMQSPINISGGMAVMTSKIDYNYKVSSLKIRNNGHTIQVDYNKGSHIVVDGHRFDLLQFHFHTPSENLVDGKTYPMEMHLVHKDAAGALAVVSVMMESGEHNIALAEVWDHMPAKAGDPVGIDSVALNVRDLLPEQGNYHHFKGSLTTPPCSEGVNWFVLVQPVPVSTAQISKFTKIIGANARPAQPIHNRLLISGR